MNFKYITFLVISLIFLVGCSTTDKCSDSFDQKACYKESYFLKAVENNNVKICDRITDDDYMMLCYSYYGLNGGTVFMSYSMCSDAPNKMVNTRIRDEKLNMQDYCRILFLTNIGREIEANEPRTCSKPNSNDTSSNFADLSVEYTKCIYAQALEKVLVNQYMKAIDGVCEASSTENAQETCNKYYDDIDFPVISED